MMTTNVLTFQIIKSQDLTERKYQEILGLCCRAYGRNLKPLMDTFHEATHILGFIDTNLVTHALWITRWLQSGDSPLLRTAYVEAVATEERYRRRGFASEVMKKLAKEIQEFDLGALSPGVTDLYSSLGWQSWWGPLYIRTQEELIHIPNEQVMILFLPETPALDLDAPLSAEWREGELW